MKTLKMMSKNIFLLTVFCLGTVVMTGSTPPVSMSSDFLVDEDIYVSANVIAQPNTVWVTITRTGPEAGLYGGCVVYTVRYNFGSPSQVDLVYRQPMGVYENSYAGAVAGPVPSVDSEVIDVQMEYDNPECHEW